MPVRKQEIEEIDVVSLVEAVNGWPAGTTGTVVMDLGEDKMVEISNERGEDLALPVVSADKLVLVGKYHR